MRFKYAAVKASEVTAPAARARSREAMDCSVGSKGCSAARGSPMAAVSDSAPAVVRKHLRSMISPCLTRTRIILGERAFSPWTTVPIIFQRFFTVPGEFVTYFKVGDVRYLIYGLCQI
jgi:hypothetical protein